MTRLHTMRTLLCVAIASITFSTAATQAQTVGTLIWEDNFDTFDTDVWNIDEGDGCDIGLCGWGNQELQWYSENNISIQAVPGEPNNNALVLDARSESTNGYSFTSGKVTTENKLSVQYGMIETRIRVPNLEQGLWPAAWMLGTSTLPWPRKGEVDMMEMGHSAAERERQGSPGVSTNNYVGSNAIFYAESACSDGNPTCAASIAYDVDYNKPYASATSMSDRFIIYRTYWTSTEMRFTVVDGETEYELYEGPLSLAGDASVFQAPFYLLLNLAVGGTFTDAAVASDVTAPLPGSMYIDYVRVYELEGEGEVITGNLTEAEDGVFGVFTETTATNASLEAGVSSDIFLWDPNSSIGSIAAFEGENVIATSFNGANTWFGGGVTSRQARDMSNFDEGVLRFNINIPANVSFQIGVTDTYSNENWVSFPAGETTYGLTRDGNWGQVEIPISDLRGTLIALQSMQYLFAISSDPNNLPTGPFEYAIDNIVWDSGNTIPTNEDDTAEEGTDDEGTDEEGTVDTDGDGVPDSQDLCPNTASGANIDADGCAVVSTELYGVEAAGAENIAFFVNTSAWADVHYVVNGGVQQNIRMTQTGTSNVFTASGINSGDSVEYFFTYWDTDAGHSIVTEMRFYSH